MSHTRANELSWLVAYSNRLGYKTSHAGLCFGVSHWVGTQLAANDIALLTSFPPLVARAAALRVLSPDVDIFDEETFFDVKAFIETTNLNSMTLDYHEELFKLNHMLTEVSGLPYTLEYLTPKSARQENQLPGIQQVYEHFVAYSKKDLPHFFFLLGQMARSQTFAAPISMVLVSGSHAICIGYDTKLKHWYLADTMMWECQTQHSPLLQIISDDKKIAELVHETLGGSATTSFMIKAYAMPESQLDMQTFFQKFHAKLNLTIRASEQDAKKNSLLHVAAQFGDLNTVIAAIGAGADVNAMNAQGCTPLHLAAYVGNTDIAKRLIRAGANLDTQSCTHGQTALMMAAWLGHIEFVRLLKDKGANLDLLCHNGRKALRYAEIYHRDEIEDLLFPTESYLLSFGLFAAPDSSDEESNINQVVIAPTHF